MSSRGTISGIISNNAFSDRLHSLILCVFTLCLLLVNQSWTAIVKHVRTRTLSSNEFKDQMYETEGLESIKTWTTDYNKQPIKHRHMVEKVLSEPGTRASVEAISDRLNIIGLMYEDCKVMIAERKSRIDAQKRKQRLAKFMPIVFLGVIILLPTMLYLIFW